MGLANGRLAAVKLQAARVADKYPVPGRVITIDVAAQIGAEYKRGKGAYLRAGEMLIGQKGKLPHGEWLPWLHANREALGFGEDTAQRLMRWAANPELEPDEVWSNSNTALTPDIEPDPAAPESDAPSCATAVAYDPTEDLFVLIRNFVNQFPGITADQLECVFARVIASRRD